MYQVMVLNIQKISDGILVAAKLEFVERAFGEELMGHLRENTSDIVVNLKRECVKHLKMKNADGIVLGGVTVQWEDVPDVGPKMHVNVQSDTVTNSVEMAL